MDSGDGLMEVVDGVQSTGMMVAGGGGNEGAVSISNVDMEPYALNRMTWPARVRVMIRS